LPPVDEPRKVIQDYAALGLSLKAHPVSFLRPMLEARGAVPAVEMRDQEKWPHGAQAAVGGMVLVRQRPGTASGIVFMTIEDETGTANLIVRPHIYQRDPAASSSAKATWYTSWSVRSKALTGPYRNWPHDLETSTDEKRPRTKNPRSRMAGDSNRHAKRWAVNPRRCCRGNRPSWR
jgi:DNA polymerase III alpha subunit